MARLTEDLRFRGLVHQMTDPGLGDHLDGDPLTVYSGFDPTADSLHVGHLLQVCTLRRLQLAGHRPIALAGGGTGFIGDPGGKSEERSLLSEEALAANLEGIRGQLGRFLDFGVDAGPSRALLLNNADWLAPMTLFDFLRGIGKHFTVNQMVAKDSVKARLEREGQGISFTEFSYMLLQAYDFLHLYDTEGCTLQIGGSDQWGNITMGIELIRKLRRAESWGLTSPLVVKADGTKFGKTETGTVWLDARRTSPYQLYQFFIRSEDAVVGSYLRYFTFLDHQALLDLDRATADHPERREAPRRTGPTGLHPGPRRGGDAPGRAGRRRPLRAPGRPARRAVPARGPGRRPLDRSRPLPAGRGRRAAGGPAGRDGHGPVQGPCPHHRGAGRGVRQRPPGDRPDPIADLHRPGGRSLPGAPPGQDRLPPGLRHPPRLQPPPPPDGAGRPGCPRSRPYTDHR